MYVYNSVMSGAAARTGDLRKNKYSNYQKNKKCRIR